MPPLSYLCCAPAHLLQPICKIWCKDFGNVSQFFYTSLNIELNSLTSELKQCQVQQACKKASNEVY